MKRVLSILAICIAVGALATSALAQGRGQGQGQGGQGGMMRGMQGMQGMQGAQEYMLLQRADVQTDLAMTAEQKTKVTAINDQMRDEMRNMMQGMRGGGGDREGMMQAMQQVQERISKQVREILTADQQKRLGEVQIQLAGPRALLLPAVQKALDLTDAQQTKIRELQQQQMEANRSVMERVRNNEIDRTQVQEIMQRNDKALGDEITKVLTDAQRAKLQTMQGKPFKADPNERGGFRIG
jgi:hypothetical protein